MSLRKERAYKANDPDKVAQHTNVHGSGSGVNVQAAQLKFAFLSGETSIPCGPSQSDSGLVGNGPVEDGGVSRGHSTVEAKAGRPEPIGCSSTTEPQPTALTPNGRADWLEDSDGKHEGAQSSLLEQILSRENMLAAWKRVKANKGAAGMDQMSTDEFAEFARHHWERIRSALYKGAYRPAAVRRVMIPKASGGQRPLGIPTVLDRVIQQAIAQVVGPLFEPTFSTHSYGFRPGKSAQMALAAMRQAHEDGYRHAVDCDLKSFFDTVAHGILMNRLARRISDRRVSRLIGRYLRSEVLLPDGSREQIACGVPQGGPLSPLLANVMLDDLDKELERRGLRFVRYADDFLIFVRSQKAAERVLVTVSRFIESQLRLTVNVAKSKAAALKDCSFLGFRLYRGKLHWVDSVVVRFKQRVREITARSNGRNIGSRIRDLRRYVIGWLNYFGHSRSYNKLVELDHWLRRRVRLCYWKQWKRPRTRRRHLLALGAKRDEVKLASRSRKGYWRMSSNRILQQALTNQRLWDRGVPNMRQQWIDLHYGPASEQAATAGTARCGPACRGGVGGGS